MKIYLVLFILNLTAHAFAEGSHNVPIIDRPIRHHLKEAVKINLDRFSRYSEISDGDSIKISSELIFYERVAPFLTKSLEKKARAYHAHNIGIFHEDMIDMALTPAFRGYFSPAEIPGDHISIPMKEFSDKWRDLLKNEKSDELYQSIVFELDEGLLKDKNQNCLSRHFTESIARSLMLLKKYQKAAVEANLPDPKNLMSEFIIYQIASLKWTYKLDSRAYPLQKKGIAIICDDVPVIPYK